jgi:hypothetical protein
MQSFKNITLRNVIIGMESLQNEVGALTGINIKFEEMSRDHIYMTSEGGVVQRYPEELHKNGIDLDIKSIIELNGAILNTLSTYLFNLRSPLNNGSMIIDLKTMNSEYLVKLNVTKHFFREKSKGRNKIELSIVKNDDDFGLYEMIMFQFTKRDLKIINALIKTIISNHSRSRVVLINAEREDLETGEWIEDVIIPVVKIDNSLAIDSIWLHGQEILNIMYVANKLITKMNIEQSLEMLNTSYRQVHFSSQNGIVYMTLTKMDSNGAIDNRKSSQGSNFVIKIQLSSIVLSILDSFLSIDILRHAESEFEYDKTIEYIGPKTTFSEITGIKYHVSMKESFLGISVHKRQKDGKKIISLLGKVKDGSYKITNEDGYIIDSVYEKDGKMLNVLNEFKIDMKDQYQKLIKALSIAYTKTYITDENQYNSLKFFTITNEQIGRVKYQFTVLANEGNKATAVLSIDKYLIKDREEHFIAGYRQPLFDRYVFQIITMLLAASDFIEDLEFVEKVNKKDLIQYRYKSMRNVVKLSKTEIIDYGLKKINGIANWGMFTDNNNMSVELTEQDQFLLNKSAESRIMNGEWIPFVGDLIAIGPDGYLTDTFGEINLEASNIGVTWAIKLYLGTTGVK